jgi:poly-gamma-glutamate synthesis protein (capsule biosynthesis protein)
MLGDSAICVGWGFRSRWPGDRAREALGSAVSLFRDVDLVIGNLETVVAASGNGGTRWQREQMWTEPSATSALAELGIHVLSVANNHAIQHGPEAFAQTVQSLESAGIVVAGRRGEAPWVCAPVVVERGELTIGVLAYCWRPRQYGNEEPPFAEGQAESVSSDIQRLRRRCTHVVVSLHWGDEFFEQPSVTQVDMARRLVDAGACLVVGHHPHVLRPVERYRDALIAYSLGNFVSDMFWLPEARLGAALTVELLPSGECGTDRLDFVEIASDYRISVVEGGVPALHGEGISDEEYEKIVAASVRRQRMFAYRYALRNSFRYPKSVLLELALRTIRNKLLAGKRRSDT